MLTPQLAITYLNLVNYERPKKTGRIILVLSKSVLLIKRIAYNRLITNTDLERTPEGFEMFKFAGVQ